MSLYLLTEFLVQGYCQLAHQNDLQSMAVDLTLIHTSLLQYKVLSMVKIFITLAPAIDDLFSDEYKLTLLL